MSSDNNKKKLDERLQNLETENEDLKRENLILSKELLALRNEIDRLREPPLLGGVIINVLNHEKSRVVVATSTGSFFVVNLSRRVKDKTVKPGMVVALNQRTFAVMEILPVSSDEIKKAKELIFLTELTLRKD
ncbi:MAG: hypothetical protein ACFE9Z_09735 [Promethearchaeota archaeon]